MSDEKREGQVIGEISFCRGDPSSIEPSALDIAHSMAMDRDDESKAVTGRVLKELVPLLIRLIDAEADRGTAPNVTMHGITRAIPLAMTLVSLPIIQDGEGKLAAVLTGIAKEITEDLEAYANGNLKFGKGREGD